MFFILLYILIARWPIAAVQLQVSSIFAAIANFPSTYCSMGLYLYMFTVNRWNEYILNDAFLFSYTCNVQVLAPKRFYSYYYSRGSSMSRSISGVWVCVCVFAFNHAIISSTFHFHVHLLDRKKNWWRTFKSRTARGFNVRSYLHKWVISSSPQLY